MFKKIFVASAVFASSAFAQNVSSMSSINTYQRQNFTIALDGVSLALKGVGVKATYAVADHVSLGLLGKTFELGTDTDSSTSILGFSSKHKVDVIGALVEFFPMGTPSERGIYISGGVTSAKVATTVEDSYYDSTLKSNDESTGAQITVGYQFVIHLGNSANIMFQTGAGFGNAGRVKWTSLGNKTELQDSLQLDLLGGAQF